MKKNVMQKNLRQSILRSLGRYIAIVTIIALGAGMFVGLRTTKSDMVATGQRFTDEQNMFDLRLLNTYGWGEEDVEKIAGMDGVVDTEGVISMDVLVTRGSSTSESVYKLYAIPEKVNKVYLLGGRMPQAPDECLADGFHTTDAILGTTVTVSGNNDPDTLDNLKQHTFTVVGYVSTPLYMDMSRGNSTLGNGSVSSYLYLPRESFDMDYYTEVDITLPGDFGIYTDAYNSAMEDAAERFEAALLPLAQERLSNLKADAEKAYAEGMEEYEKGMEEYRKGKEEAFRELTDAKQKLEDAEKEIADNRKFLEDSQEQLVKGQEELDKNRQTLAKTKAETYEQLSAANAELMKNYKNVAPALRQVNDGLAQIESGLAQIESGITQLESGLEQLDSMLRLIDTMLPIVNRGIETAEAALERAEQSGTDADTIAALRKELEEHKASRDEYTAQQQQLHADQEQYTKQLAELKNQKGELTAQRQELHTTQKSLSDAMAEIEAGLLELSNSQTQAENGFAAAEAELEAARIQLDTGKKDAEEGLVQLADAEQELNAGWEEYHKGYQEAMEEIADAGTKLAEAKLELDDARKTIDDMTDTDVYALDRTTNVGYVSLDSNSDIVEGVSAVFPAFFLLIAALVCITTMTRMVEEERTQIGTLKALGYSNGAIIGKYLAYAGSAAVLGCGLGVTVGSVAFPLILWEAYGIMMLLTPSLVLQIDWPLCLSVVGMYTGVTLLVTWYCCRMTLREVPAELIRPKAPTSGKKVFLEKLPLWEKLSFLNKVMLRNIFRYRQRLLMMLVGIGGCTALLLTGFGFRDSILDIVDYQFREITLYDMEVRFSEPMSPTQQASFRKYADRYAEDMAFYHQSSVELEYGDTVKEISLIATDADITRFMDFHSGDEALPLPGEDEALLSVGIAENLSISPGDTVTVRNADMQPMTVTVTGLYDNYVYNYLIVGNETVARQWEQEPDKQIACISIKPDRDAHEAAAELSKYSGVVNVSVNQDIANTVGTMLEALDLVVVTIVICAGMLAVIVLYNLTNINITERIREIATIKVLGFNAAESASYVFKENLLLTAMGSVCGLAGGIWLLEFVMSKIRIDMVWLPARLRWLSFVISLVLTMLSACFVDFLLYFKLEKINMAEALKSVE